MEPTAYRVEEARQADKSGRAFVFDDVLPIILRESRVPARLPGFLPGVDKAHPIYVVKREVTPSNYDLLLAVDLPCDGQNNCLYGSVTGSVSPPDKADGTPVSILLKGRLKAAYFRPSCHAYCSEAYVKWREGQYYYAVGLKAGTLPQLRKVAESAISDAPR
jgi:hypothetical protein